MEEITLDKSESNKERDLKWYGSAATGSLEQIIYFIQIGKIKGYLQSQNLSDEEINKILRKEMKKMGLIKYDVHPSHNINAVLKTLSALGRFSYLISKTEVWLDSGDLSYLTQENKKTIVECLRSKNTINLLSSSFKKR